MKFNNNRVSIAFDVYGCPQRCKHCWIGHPENKKMDADECIKIFLSIKNEQKRKGYCGVKIEYFSPEFREYHYGDDYKELYKRADEINGCLLDIEKKFELLSIWRLTRDKKYVKWAKKRGYKRSQIKIFGLRETNDFFYGRKGAHNDIINSTRILLDNGIIPRWQIYYNKKGINELTGVLELTRKLDIWSKVKKLGEEFNIHAMTFDLDGSGYTNQRYCIEQGDEEKIPQLLWKKSRDHFGDSYGLFPEYEMVKKILKEEDRPIIPQGYRWPWFYVTSDWSIYPNFMNIAPYWKLGNLKEDSWEEIMKNYSEDKNIGLKVLRTESFQSLAKRYGDPKGSRLSMSIDDLVNFYAGKYCRELYYGRH